MKSLIEKNPPTKRGRGRPKGSLKFANRVVNNKKAEHKYLVNEVSKRQVRRLLACGTSMLGIAAVLDCSVDTLRANFKEEIQTGREKAKAEIFDMLYALADSGNVSAVRKLHSIVHGDKSSIPTFAEVKEMEKQEPKQGKKEMQQKEADSIAGKYAPPSAPNKTLQ